MRLHDLKPAPGSRKNRKVIGRGSGSGHGKTSCKGHKGQNSRSGPKRVPGFEGGQMPIHRRLPKRGFTNLFRVEYQPVNIKRLEEFKDVTEFNLEAFIKLGIAGKKDRVKVLGFGDISRAITVSAHRFSKSAKEKIEAAGGKALEI